MIIVSPWHGPSTDHLSLSPASPGAAPGRKFGCDWGLRTFEHGQTLLAGLRVRFHHLPSGWPWLTGYPVAIRTIPMAQPRSSSLAGLHSTPACGPLWGHQEWLHMIHYLVPTRRQLPRRDHGTVNPKFFWSSSFFPHCPLPEAIKEESQWAHPLGDGPDFKEGKAVALFSLPKERKTISRCLLPRRPQAVADPIFPIPWALHANLRFVKKYLDSR